MFTLKTTLKILLNTFLFGLLIAVCFVFLDTQLLVRIQPYSQKFLKLFKAASVLISPAVHLAVWTVLFTWFLTIKRDYARAHELYPLVFSLIMGNTLVRIVKFILARSRPELFVSRGIDTLSWFSFDRIYSSIPSGHATTIGAVFGFLACKYPRFAFFFILLSLFLSLSRVFVEAHYLSDILLGNYIGFYLTWLAYYRSKPTNLSYLFEKGKIHGRLSRI